MARVPTCNMTGINHPVVKMPQVRETLEHRLGQTPDNPHTVDPVTEAISRKFEKVRFLVISDHARAKFSGVGMATAGDMSALDRRVSDQPWLPSKYPARSLRASQKLWPGKK